MKNPTSVPRLCHTSVSVYVRVPATNSDCLMKKTWTPSVRSHASLLRYAKCSLTEQPFTANSLLIIHILLDTVHFTHVTNGWS